MGQKIKEDKIGSLSHSSGVITLQASILTIGGQQYTTSALQLTLSGLSVHTTYMLYVVLNSGVPTLVSSTNVNSVGPAGFASWKLVGAFIANQSAAFGAFLNIEGVPVCAPVLWLPSNTGFGTLSGNDSRFWRNGKYLEGQLKFATGTVTGAVASVGLPDNLAMDATVMTQQNYWLSVVLNNSNVAITQLQTNFATNATSLFFAPANALGNINNGNTSPFASGQVQSAQFKVPIAAWSNTPLKDL